MTRTRKSALIVAPLIAILSLSVVAAVSPTYTTSYGTAVRQADLWALDHSATLPKTLDGIAKLPMVYRKAVMRHLTPRERGAVWHQQLQTFIMPAAHRSALQTRMVKGLGITLNPQQIAAIRVVDDSFAAIFNSGADDATRAQRIDAACAKLDSIMPKTAHILIAATIGLEDTTFDRLVTTSRVRGGVVEQSMFSVGKLVRLAASKLGVKLPGQYGGPCSCQVGSGCSCLLTGTCETWYCNPVIIGGDCGCGWSGSCDGACP